MDKSTDFSVLFKKAENAWRSGDLGTAETLFGKLLETDPGNARILNSLGVVALQRNQKEKGRKLLENAAAIQPDYIEPYQNLALLYQNNGAPEKAIGYYEKILRIDPRNRAVYHQAAGLMIKLKRYEDARTCLGRATDLFPDDIPTWEAYGDLNYENGNLEEARRANETIIKLEAGYLRAHYNLGLIYRRQNKSDKAEESFTRALRLSPGNVLVLKQLGTNYFSRGEIEKALQVFQQIIRTDATDVEAIFNAGICLKEKREYHSALSLFEKVIRLDPDHLNAQFNAGEILTRLGNHSKAAGFLKKVLQIQPDNMEALHRYGVTLYRMGKYDDAQGIYEKIQTLDPAIPDTYYNLGIIHKFKQNRETAVRFLKKYMALGGNRSAAEHEIATITGNTPKQMPEEYVVKLFDDFADRFDRDLVKNLKYKAPDLLKKTFEEYLGFPRRFSRVCDLGCGTGLSGSAFKNMAIRMTGVDLSGKMLAKAREKDIYQELYQQDIVSFLKETRDRFDLFIATDLLIYIGDVSDLFAGVRRCTGSGAYFAFTTETCRESYRLRQSGRYAHSEDYIREMSLTAQFSVETVRGFDLRLENKIWIPGNLFILKSV